jgi:hypothetical protein
MPTKQIRFEVPLSPARFAEIGRLAEQIEISPRDVARLAIARLLANKSELLGRPSTPLVGGTVLAEVHDLSELHRALRERSEALNLSRNGLDALAGLETGYSAKVLAQNPARCLGPVSLPLLLGALGLKLLVVEDQAAMARLQSRLSGFQRKRSRHLPDITPADPAPAQISTTA